MGTFSCRTVGYHYIIQERIRRTWNKGTIKFLRFTGPHLASNLVFFWICSTRIESIYEVWRKVSSFRSQLSHLTYSTVRCCSGQRRRVPMSHRHTSLMMDLQRKFRHWDRNCHLVALTNDVAVAFASGIHGGEVWVRTRVVQKNAWRNVRWRTICEQRRSVESSHVLVTISDFSISLGSS